MKRTSVPVTKLAVHASPSDLLEGEENDRQVYIAQLLRLVLILKVWPVFGVVGEEDEWGKLRAKINRKLTLEIGLNLTGLNNKYLISNRAMR